jgi:hypothetical protein
MNFNNDMFKNMAQGYGVNEDMMRNMMNNPEMMNNMRNML